jgi:signal transduction histidine kinase
VGDLLEFAREKPPSFQKIQITPLIRDVLHNLTMSGEMEKVRVQVSAAEDIEMKADQHLIEQVFVNLFTNAIHAMDGSGSLTVSASRADGVVKITVSDTGPGIPEKDIPRIFDPFFSTKHKGTGLGLAIVYNIIQKHYGKITVASSPGKGATFTILLPEE